ncbi:uncharacterized protein LOC121369383 [Gigantopelta aegis]|uniref:uncharacterized protein LOC121369383 n=1 Tax=Gigantopelta aegis TaxID=1735272 RepID=UPI001B88915B|nr:uncharacterized protein LOC121369383 [Gigantopelta aegis]
MQSVYGRDHCLTMAEMDVGEMKMAGDENKYTFKHKAMSVMLSEMQAFQRHIEHSILVVRRESYYIAGILCAITMLILVVGSLYCHFHGNRRYVRYTKLSRDENSNNDKQNIKSENGRHKPK